MKFPVAERFRVGALESDCLPLTRGYMTWDEIISCPGPQSPHLESGDDDDVASVNKDSLSLICEVLF